MCQSAANRQSLFLGCLHVDQTAFHSMENHPAFRTLFIGDCDVAGGAFPLSHGAQFADLVEASSSQMLNEAAQARIEAQGEAQALAISRQFMDAYQYGNGFARQVLFLREQSEKRFLDAFDLREDLTRQVKAALASQPRLAGFITGVRSECAGWQGSVVRSSKRTGQQRQRPLCPVLVTTDAGQADLDGPARIVIWPTPAPARAARPITPGSLARAPRSSRALSNRISMRSTGKTCC
jgi:hypothetical protein